MKRYIIPEFDPYLCWKTIIRKLSHIFLKHNPAQNTLDQLPMGRKYIYVLTEVFYFLVNIYVANNDETSSLKSKIFRQLSLIINFKISRAEKKMSCQEGMVQVNL